MADSNYKMIIILYICCTNQGFSLLLFLYICASSCVHPLHPHRLVVMDLDPH